MVCTRSFFAVFTALCMWFSACLPAHAAPVTSPAYNSSVASNASGGADNNNGVDGRYGSIVVDVDSLEIVHARQIDAKRYPASLTKLMTLYLTFDALDSGQLKIDQKLTVSRNAQNTPPGKLGVKAGQTITVDQAIQALAVKSANDVAVVLAEALGGTEAQFAEMMTEKALSLGMIKTEFSNPHGLPNPLQVTTARDMAKLALAHLNNHRRYYHYFGQKIFRYKGKEYKNTNSLLHSLAGIDGFKTGYTRASGYNLVISAEREGRRIIAVVLGGASSGSRNTHMKDLVERSFDTLGVQPVASLAPVAVSSKKAPSTPKRQVIREPVPKKAAPKNAAYKTSLPAAVRLRGRNSAPVTIITQGDPAAVFQPPALDHSWAIQIGAFANERAATAQLESLSLLVGAGAAPAISRIENAGRTLFRARFTQMNFENAHETCRALGALKTGCVVISPSGR